MHGECEFTVHHNEPTEATKDQLPVGYIKVNTVFSGTCNIHACSSLRATNTSEIDSISKIVHLLRIGNETSRRDSSGSSDERKKK